MFIRTVIGDINKEQMGKTQCHEHLFIREGVSGIANQSLCMESSLKASRELELYYKNGGRTLVDAQPIGCGRMPRLLKEVSEYSGIHIIASTGFHKLIFYPENHWIFQITTEELAQIFIEEIRDGMFILCDTEYPKYRMNAKAGMIKVALDIEGMTRRYQKIHLAAIRAAKQTGVSIQCHIETANNAMEVIDFYNNQGFDLSKMILAHLDRKESNLVKTIELLKYGVYVQLDTIGRFRYHDTKTEINFIKRLLKEGYGRNILLGLDTTRARLKAYGNNIGLDFLLNDFVFAMKENNIKQVMIDKMLRDNPYDALSMKTGTIGH